MEPTDRAESETIDRKNRRLAVAAAVAMDGQRAEDILILDLRGLVDYTDYFVVASAASVMRVRGVARAAEKMLVALDARRLNRPDRETGWVLLDYGDVIVHIFDKAAREFYRLEDLWGDAPTVEWRGANAETREIRAGLPAPAEAGDAED